MIPLLTIAIPTFNRDRILDGALNSLLPQIAEFNHKIELIVSDNASTDNTQSIITKHIVNYPQVKIVSNLQPYNTGYYGNFRKCRELSNGKYFWLLSDNEHIHNGIITTLMNYIAEGNDVGVYFLNNKTGNARRKQNELIATDSDIISLNEEESAYQLTLISSVILLNDKQHDEYVFNKYPDNSFLGFLLLCNALRANKSIKVITGNIFSSVPCNVNFNIFESWTAHISQAVDYFVEGGILDEQDKKRLITSFLKHVVRLHVNAYKLNGILHGKKYGTNAELRATLDSYYIDNDYYVSRVRPIFNKNVLLFKITNFSRRVRNKMLSTIKTLSSKH